MASKNPIVYLIKLISKKMQKEINEETSDVYRKRLEIREQNLQAIYQSDENREKIKKIKEGYANLKEKKEKYEKSKDGVSLYDKMVKFLDGINISLKLQDNIQLANPVLAPGVIAGKVRAFIAEQKLEVEYIKRVAKTQKRIIKEDLKLYGEALEVLIEEINKGNDEYRQEILSKLDPWAQQDPYIAEAPYNQIMPRYQERLGAAEVKAEEEQLAGGKVLNPNLFKMEELKIKRPSADLIASMLPVERAQLNVGDSANTDEAKTNKLNADYAALEARLAQEMKDNPDAVYYSGTGTQAEKKARYEALRGEVLSRINPFEETGTSTGDSN